MAGPTPAPVKVKGLSIPTTLPTDSSGNLYGLSTGGQGYLFDTTGLGGAFQGTGGKISGKDLIDSFLSMGNGLDANDPRVAVVSAIQYALYAAHSYYPTNFTPTPGVVTTQDVKALGQALENLYNANQMSVGANADGSPMNVTQFLTSQSSMGLNGGPLAAQSVNPPMVANIRSPNAANVAAVFRQVAQKIEGHKPSDTETQAFVRQYVQQYVGDEKANANALYQAQVQKAQDRAAGNPQGPPPTIDNPGAGNLNPNVNQEGTGAASGNMNPAVQGGGPAPWETAAPPASLTETQQSLQDLINQRAKAASAGQSGDPSAPSRLIEAGTSQPEDVSVAAENFARNANPKAAGATDLNDTFQTFLQLLSGKL